MQRLTPAMLGRVSRFLRDAYAVHSLDALRSHITRAISQVIASDVTTYNEVDTARKRITWIDEPAGACSFPGSTRIFGQYIADHPLINYYAQTDDGRALKISDFLTQREFKRRGIYSEFYRRVSMNYQLAVTLPSPRPLVIGIALNRQSRDFSESDRFLLNIIRPHLLQAYKNAARSEYLSKQVALFAQGFGVYGCDVVILNGQGRIEAQSQGAALLLDRYFGHEECRHDRLPQSVNRWIAARRFSQPLEDVGRVLGPLTVEREGTRLIMSVISRPGQSLLILEERRTTPDARALAGLGLSHREAQLLNLVIEGKSNAEIAHMVSIAHATVRKHLEHIYLKLGVRTRAEAVAKALKSIAKLS